MEDEYEMRRTISAMIGKGSASHNSRKFKAANVDPERTPFNIDYCNEPIREVYHKLFDEALERYNARQTRSDRMIDDYYEKIRTSRQEKLFHELILQIGNRDDTGAETEIGEQSKVALDEYYRGFQERNPNLYVFSAHLHMDEATPHIHIDFVPFTTGSKRGLDTRVSLKQALAAQGFKGGNRGATEWTQWIQAEKEVLAQVMERYGFEWEEKGTHEQHLSVIDYKKQERQKELAAVEEILAESKAEFMEVEERLRNYQSTEVKIWELEKKLDSDPEFQLPDPGPMMSARTYRTRFGSPAMDKLKQIIKYLLLQWTKAMDEFLRANRYNGALYRENESLSQENDRLREENEILRRQNKDHALLRKVFGRDQVDGWVRQAQELQQRKREAKKYLER